MLSASELQRLKGHGLQEVRSSGPPRRPPIPKLSWGTHSLCLRQYSQAHNLPCAEIQQMNMLLSL